MRSGSRDHQGPSLPGEVLVFIGKVDVYCRLSFGLRGAARKGVKWTARSVTQCQCLHFVCAFSFAVILHGLQYRQYRITYCANCLTSDEEMKNHQDACELIKFQVRSGELPYDVLIQDHELGRAC